MDSALRPSRWHSSLVAQCDDRIDTHSAPCWQVRRRNCNRRQQDRDANECYRVVGTHTEKQACQESHQREGPGEPQTHSYQRQLYRMAQNHALHIAWLCSKCHANSYFLPPLAHGLAHHTVDADGGQCQWEYRKDSYQYRREEVRRQGIRKQSIHGHNVSHRQAAVGSVDDVCCCGRHRGWVGRCTDDEIWCPSSREVDVERGLALQFELVYVAYNSDDRAPARFFIERTDIDALAERVTAGPEAPRHRTVDRGVGEPPSPRLKKRAAPKGVWQRRKIAGAAGANWRKRTSA